MGNPEVFSVMCRIKLVFMSAFMLGQEKNRLQLYAIRQAPG
jgi:hypothetical protein